MKSQDHLCSSAKELFEVFGGISEHLIVTFEVKIFKKISKLLHLYFSWVDAFSSNLKLTFKLLQDMWFCWTDQLFHFLEQVLSLLICLSLNKNYSLDHIRAEVFFPMDTAWRLFLRLLRFHLFLLSWRKVAWYTNLISYRQLLEFLLLIKIYIIQK